MNWDARTLWFRATCGLGAAELLTGGTLCFRGVRYGWAAGDSLSNLWGTIVILTGLFGFAVPGSLLFLKNPLRWIPQMAPALAAAFGSTIIAQGLGLR
jgi:hypothetical protein